MEKEKRLQVDIITPVNIIYSGDAISVEMPGIDGKFTLMPYHCPMVAGLKEGRIKLREEAGIKIFKTGVGIVKVDHNKADILVEYAK